MKYFYIFFFTFTYSFLASQSSIYPDLVLMGTDTLPSGTSVSDTFLVFDIQKGALHGGEMYYRPWHRDSMGLLGAQCQGFRRQWYNCNRV